MNECPNSNISIHTLKQIRETQRERDIKILAYPHRNRKGRDREIKIKKYQHTHREIDKGGHRETEIKKYQHTHIEIDKAETERQR